MEPIAEFTKEITETVDNSIDKALDKVKEIINEIQKAFETLKDTTLEKIDDLADHIAGELSKWLALNRNGKHYFVDPLVLDLDGDGIETVGHNKKKGAMFDFDNRGYKVATGWVKSDDGILVFDRNGDGIINNGIELFGDYTLLTDGTVAKHGFMALADLDSNQDGKIGRDDEHFDKLQIWRDFNQNGVSEADELVTLSSLGITALNVNYQDTNKSLAGGNKLAQIGSYEKSDGTLGIMGDVNFAFNDVYSVHHYLPTSLTNDNLINNNPFDINTALFGNAPTTPNIDMKGAGRVPDLSIAMQKSDTLNKLVLDYIGSSIQKRKEMMFELLKEWAKTDPNYKEFSDMSMSLEVSAGTEGAVAISASRKSSLFTPKPEVMQAFNEAKSKIGIIDSFLGTKTDRLYYLTEQDIIHTTKVINDIYDKISSAVYGGLDSLAENIKHKSSFDIVIDISDDGVGSSYAIHTRPTAK